MMDFIVMTISISVAILLACVFSVLIMASAPVRKMYMKFMVKTMKEFDEVLDNKMKGL